MNQIKSRFGIDSFALKMIAIAAMLTDHIGAGIYPTQIWWRVAGRLAFPIFAFLLCEGYFHTSSVKRYAIRLGVFALISEVPFDLFHNGGLFDANAQNIFLTLLIGLLTMYLMDRYGRRIDGKNGFGSDLFKRSLIMMSGIFLAEFIHSDYGAFGVATILIFYMLRERRVLALACVAAANLLYGLLSVSFGYMPTQAFAAAAVIPIYLYNGKKGHSLKYAFYAFYPAHIAAITAVKYFIK